MLKSWWNSTGSPTSGASNRQGQIAEDYTDRAGYNQFCSRFYVLLRKHSEWDVRNDCGRNFSLLHFFDELLLSGSIHDLHHYELDHKRVQHWTHHLGRPVERLHYQREHFTRIPNYSLLYVYHLLYCRFYTLLLCIPRVQSHAHGIHLIRSRHTNDDGHARNGSRCSTIAECWLCLG